MRNVLAGINLMGAICAFVVADRPEHSLVYLALGFLNVALFISNIQVKK